MRNRLLDRLYGAFDRDARHVGALSIAHDQGVSWSVDRHRLVVHTEAGVPLADVSLRDGTLDQLVSTLAGAGLVASLLVPAMGPMHPGVLISGSGSDSSGSELLAHRSILWALMDGYAMETEAAEDRVPLALEQARLHSADGDWLDFWGSYFGVGRIPGQSDAAYLGLIVTETLRPRSNKYAIERAVFDATGKVIDIVEPWRQIFILDSSTLSGDHKFKDGQTIGGNLIVPTALEPLDWAPVLAVIHRNRAAGVMVLPPAMRITAGIDASLHGDVLTAILRVHFGATNYEDRTRLDFNAIEDVPVLSSPILYRRELRHLTYTDAVVAVSIESLRQRSYRFYAASLEYPSRGWESTLSWGPSTSWRSITVTISTIYTRT